MNKRDRVVSYVNTVLDMPADVVGQLPRLVLTGDRSLFLENHRGILAFSPSVVRVAYRGGNLEIRGRELMLTTIDPDELEVVGVIQALTFESLS